MIAKNTQIAEMLTSHFVTISKGNIPFTLDWEQAKVAEMAGNERDAVDYMRVVCAKVPTISMPFSQRRASRSLANKAQNRAVFDQPPLRPVFQRGLCQFEWQACFKADVGVTRIRFVEGMGSFSTIGFIWGFGYLLFFFLLDLYVICTPASVPPRSQNSALFPVFLQSLQWATQRSRN